MLSRNEAHVPDELVHNSLIAVGGPQLGIYRCMLVWGALYHDRNADMGGQVTTDPLICVLAERVQPRQKDRPLLQTTVRAPVPEIQHCEQEFELFKIVAFPKEKYSFVWRRRYGVEDRGE